jgi:hypothetical protein
MGQPARKPAVAESDEITARAARLGITIERVLLEYERIAFANLGHIIELTDKGYRLRPLSELSPDDIAAIHEIVPGDDPEHARVKLYDKKPALDAIARHLGMFPAPPRRQQQGPADSVPREEAEDPREILARELARLAAGGGKT